MWLIDTLTPWFRMELQNKEMFWFVLVVSLFRSFKYFVRVSIIILFTLFYYILYIVSI